MAMGIIWFILLGSLYLFSAVILFNTSPVLSSLIIFIGLVHLVFRGIRPALSRMLLVRRTRRAVAACILEHTPVLARKRGQLVKKDDYGIVHYEEWEQEKEYFINVVLGEHFNDILSEEFPLTAGHIDEIIEKAIDKVVLDLYGNDPVQEPEDEPWEEDEGDSYRQYCTRLLDLAGWKVLADGEEGQDKGPVLAERGEQLFVVTCISSSSPVGIRTIWRTSVAMKKLGAHMAAVVTNAGFSRLARMASSRYGVMPLHHEDLANI
jgi:restriction system protein